MCSVCVRATGASSDHSRNLIAQRAQRLRGYCVWLYCSESKVKERGHGIKLVTGPSRASAQQERWCLLLLGGMCRVLLEPVKGLRSARLKLKMALFRDYLEMPVY